MLFILLDLNQASKCGGKRRLAIKIAIEDTTSWSSNFFRKTLPEALGDTSHCGIKRYALPSDASLLSGRHLRNTP
jgi:hypothetical protein